MLTVEIDGRRYYDHAYVNSIAYRPGHRRRGDLFAVIRGDRIVDPRWVEGSRHLWAADAVDAAEALYEFGADGINGFGYDRDGYGPDGRHGVDGLTREERRQAQAETSRFLDDLAAQRADEQRRADAATEPAAKRTSRFAASSRKEREMFPTEWGVDGVIERLDELTYEGEDAAVKNILERVGTRLEHRNFTPWRVTIGDETAVIAYQTWSHGHGWSRCDWSMRYRSVEEIVDALSNILSQRDGYRADVTETYDGAVHDFGDIENFIAASVDGWATLGSPADGPGCCGVLVKLGKDVSVIPWRYGDKYVEERFSVTSSEELVGQLNSCDYETGSGFGFIISTAADSAEHLGDRRWRVTFGDETSVITNSGGQWSIEAEAGA